MRQLPENEIIDWLLKGDVAIQYQTRRDLLGDDCPDLRDRIDKQGWGAVLMASRHANGSWGRGFYEPKWTNSHYTLLDLRKLNIDPGHPLLKESVQLISKREKRADGGVGPGKTIAVSDVCVNGMFLNYASYFGEAESELRSVVDFLIGQHMPDGGFNCRSNRSGATHSSLHSSVSVLEGIRSYHAAGYSYRCGELLAIADQCREFMLIHRLFRSDRTGAIIHPAFLKFPYPWRWKYNVLRALDCFATSRSQWDDRMQDAIDVLHAKRRPDGRWLMEAAHPGTVHVQMEKAREPSRWNTLIALRVLRFFGKLC
jgi:hypothetical protein